MTNKVTCGQCGAVFEDDPNVNPESRKPCPACRSTKREISGRIELIASYQAQISGTVTLASDAASIILKSVIESGDRTSEGRIIQAVTLPWLKIIEMINHDPDAVYQIDPWKWEEIIAGGYTQAGFDEVILTPRSGDLGRDVIAEKRGTCTVRVIDQVKAYKSDHLVTANDVRALAGVLLLEDAAKGYVTTTADFAPRVCEDRLLQKLLTPKRIELINRESLIERLNEPSRMRG